MSVNILFFFVFIVSFLSLFILRKLAQRIALVDKPNERKLHTGQVPLVGGIGVFVTIMLLLLFNADLLMKPFLYSGCASILVIIGIIDDKFDISVKLRLVVQTFISLIMIVFGDRNLQNLGYLTGSESILLPAPISIVITILAVIGAINAFNMVDGIDGLLGGLASVTFSGLGILFYLHGMNGYAIFCGLLVTAMLPYVMLNLGVPFGRRFKVFMGDAGSIFIGFTVIWLLIVASQGERATAIRPVTALWLIALPLIDMVCIMIRRIRKGQSPFRPDREHLHHICQRVGLSSHKSLMVICAAAGMMAVIGIGSEIAKVDENIMFFLFLVLFLGYFILMNNIWRITAFLRRDVNFSKTI